MSIIRFVDVEKHYRLGKTTVVALNKINLEIRKGEFVAVVGPSGSGKTTLLNLMGCIDSPSAGQIFIDNKEVSGLSERQATRIRLNTIGFTFQSFNLIPVLSVFENVELPLLLQRKPKAERRKKVERILERVGLSKFASHKPDELSGGQRQRVAIARALIAEPSIVIADEPTANLDSQTGESIMQMMLNLNREIGTTFVISTHDPMVMKYARRSITIKDGRLADEHELEAEQPALLS